MNTKNNRRRQETRKQIERTFIELLQSKEIDTITVSEICNRVGVNRSTFYANYEDIYALAAVLRAQLEAEVAGMFSQGMELIFSGEDYRRLLCHMRDNRLFYLTYFKLGYDAAYSLDMSSVLKSTYSLPQNHLDYHILFFRAGFNAIVKKWLVEGCRETPEEMGEILRWEYQGRQ